MFRFVLGIAASVAAVSGLVILVSIGSHGEVPSLIRMTVFALVVLLYGLAGPATVQELLVRRQRIIDAGAAVPATRLNPTDGPTVVIAGLAPLQGSAR
jgi:hypothetical protein